MGETTKTGDNNEHTKLNEKAKKKSIAGFFAIVSIDVLHRPTSSNCPTWIPHQTTFYLACFLNSSLELNS